MSERISKKTFILKYLYVIFQHHIEGVWSGAPLGKFLSLVDII